MRDVIWEPEETLKERWMNSSRAIFMISMLPRESWPKLYSGLKAYVRWLIEERRDAKALRAFDSRIEKAEAELRESVESGEMSQAEADTKLGDGIWWKALEETQDASLFIALKIILDRDISAFLKKEPAENTKTLDEIRDEVEPKLIGKLRQFVNIDDV